MKLPFTLLGLFGLLATACDTAPSPPGDLDLLIVGGTIVDGTGAEGIQGDVGVIGDRIAWVGQAGEATAPDSIDATGLVVAPGFIDVHSHTPPQIASEAFRLNEGVIRQGVTTVIGGPDGQVSAGDLRRLVAAHDSIGIGTNVGYYVGHNSIRNEVMGDDQQRAPTAEELAEEVAPFGGIYDSHVRNPVHAFLESDQEVITIAEAAGIGGKIGHIKGVGLHNEGVIAEIIEMVEAARARGSVIVSDQYPYDGAATAPIAGILVVPPDMAGVTTLRGILTRGTEPTPEARAVAQVELVAAASDPARWAALKEASENGVNGGFAWLKATGYTSMRIVSAPGRPDLVGRYLSEIAEEGGEDPFKVVTDLLVTGTPINLTLGAIKEPDVRMIMVQPWNMIASDGGWADGSDSPEGHPRSAGTFARLLGHYVREEGVLPLEEAVRKITSLPADFLGLEGRGRIRTGDVADLSIFNPRTIIDRSDWDYPNRFAEGVEYVLVNGVKVLSEGDMTGEAPGRIVRRSDGSNP